MSVGSLGNLGSALAGTGVSGSGASNASGSNPTEQDFLTLLSAELQYQDPSQPVDSTQFIAELAQFSTLSGINNMETTLQSVLQAVQSGSNPLLAAAGLIGKQVTTATGSGTVTSVSMESGQTGGITLDVSGLGSVSLADVTGVSS